MRNEAVHSEPGLVDVTYRPDIGAVCLKWHSEYDEGTAVRDAVLAALDFVNARGVRNWLADLSTSARGLSDADQEWVTGPAFLDAMRDSCLTRFVLVPPGPETGQDTGWLADWEANTLRAFGRGKCARILSDSKDVAAFFRDAKQGDLSCLQSSRTERLSRRI